MTGSHVAEVARLPHRQSFLGKLATSATCEPAIFAVTKHYFFSTSVSQTGSKVSPSFGVVRAIRSSALGLVALPTIRIGTENAAPVVTSLSVTLAAVAPVGSDVTAEAVTPAGSPTASTVIGPTEPAG